jgi:iron(III) transport system substrate-binding protein
MDRPTFFVVLAALVAAFGIWRFTSRTSADSVVVYVSHDQVFSEPILRDFERETGVTVKAVYDTEETKSTGVMNRLIAEKNNPQADVYWANEPIRAEVLRQQGLTKPYRSAYATGIAEQFRDPQGHWTGFSARARMFIVPKTMADKPASILAYADPRYKGSAVIANPLFGTTTAHMAALFVVWGDARATQFLEAMRANGVRFSSSNGESADLVARGGFRFALVDSDDLHSRQKQGAGVEGVYPDQEEGGLGCFIVPNAVLLIQGGPHPDAGQLLVDYLLSPDTERKLAFSDAAQIPLRDGVEAPPAVPRLQNLKVMKVDYAAVAAKMQAIQPLLKDWAGR